MSIYTQFLQVSFNNLAILLRPSLVSQWDVRYLVPLCLCDTQVLPFMKFCFRKKLENHNIKRNMWALFDPVLQQTNCKDILGEMENIYQMV